MRVSAPSGPSRWSWPTTSASFCGRSLSASGRGASLSRPAAANRLGRRFGRELPSPCTRRGHAGPWQAADLACSAAILPHGRDDGRDAHSSAEHGRNLLAAAQDGDAPQPAAGLGDAFEVAGLGDLLVVDRDARCRRAGSRGSAPASRRRRRPRPRPRSRRRAAARRRAPATGWRPWRRGTASAPGSRSRRAASPARFRARPRPCSPCRRAPRRAAALPPSGLVAKR